MDHPWVTAGAERKQTHYAFHLSHLPSSINAKGEVLNGQSSSWARCTWGNIRGIFSFRKEIEPVDQTTHCFYRPSWQGHHTRASSTVYRVQLLSWHFTVKLSKLFLFFFSLFYQFNINNFLWHCFCGAAGTETWATGTETTAIWKWSKWKKKYIRRGNMWCSCSWHLLPSVVLWGDNSPNVPGWGSAGPCLLLQEVLMPKLQCFMAGITAGCGVQPRPHMDTPNWEPLKKP